MTRKSLLFALMCTLLLAGGLTARAGDVLDRIVATVNGHIILQSDWEKAIRCEAFIANRSLDQITFDDRKGALDRLIDQELLREQMSATDFPQQSDEEVAKRMQEVRKQYPGAETDPGWQAALARYGLTEADLKQRIALQLNLMHLVDARLRPTVDIDSKSIESYYNQQLLPQLRQSGAKDVPLAEVTPKIKELLTQEKVSQLLTAWLQNLRSGSEIRTNSVQSDGSQAR